ncbi:MAG: hypothetical protein KC419_25615 [Anaerolineales bacterium]|nr:hypothetical protein [Anaerolineales bacterium]MCA9931898.1 hypothetical protein [Anaerolineales bacterium]
MNASAKRLLRNFFIELIIYGVLLAIYFSLVLRYLGRPLNDLFHLNPIIYAIATLLLIVVQSVVLERFTSYLIRWLGLDRLE